MKVLILGANGMMGPHVVKALEDEHTLRLTDINDLEDTPHEYFKVDASVLDQVVAAAEGMDAIINLSVKRYDRQRDFDVNARGCFNTMSAAVQHGIRRVINTGPYESIFGSSYSRFDYPLGPDVPHHTGTHLYGLTKSLGQQICRAFTETHDVYVMTFLFWSFDDPADRSLDGQGIGPFSAAWDDLSVAFQHGLSIGLDQLPSRYETFTISADLPHQKFSHEKATRILGWKPKSRLEHRWRKAK